MIFLRHRGRYRVGDGEVLALDRRDFDMIARFAGLDTDVLSEPIDVVTPLAAVGDEVAYTSGPASRYLFRVADCSPVGIDYTPVCDAGSFTMAFLPQD